MLAHAAASTQGLAMIPKSMKPLRWPSNKDQSDYMRMRLKQNRKRSKLNKNEHWMMGKLHSTPYKWTHQAMWGYRIFDFWCAELGIAVEVDGPEHNAKVDAYRDEYNLRRSGIIVIRVRNRNEDDARECITKIMQSESWTDRRQALGIKGSKRDKRHLVTACETASNGELF